MKEVLFQASTLMGLIFAYAALAVCLPFVFLNAAARAQGVSRQVDIAYGPLSRQKLDLYVPDADAKRPLPIVVFFMVGLGDWRTPELPLRGRSTGIARLSARRSPWILSPRTRRGHC